MDMHSLFNLIAAGVGSLSFSPTMELPEFEYSDYKRQIMPIKPRTPEEIMRSAWEEVGNSIWDAMKVVEAEYGQQITQSK